MAQVARLLSGQQLSDTVWVFELGGAEQGRRQRVFVTHEVMPPALEFVRVTAAVSMMSLVDAEAVIRRIGQLQTGCVSFTPSATEGRPDDGIVNLCTVIPLAALDLSEPTPFLLYLTVFARTADTLEGELLPAGAPDMF
jgi:hypothetical protein